MGTITLAREAFCGLPLIVNAEDGRDILVQTDYDYPGIASTFGWWVGMVPAGDESVLVVAFGDFRACPDEHSGTDGTIDCETCGAPVGAFISSARDYLDDNLGATADDPGYF